MKQSFDPISNHPSGSQSRRAERLRKRLRELNARGEKELAAVMQNIERAKAAFRSHKR